MKKWIIAFLPTLSIYAQIQDFNVSYFGKLLAIIEHPSDCHTFSLNKQGFVENYMSCDESLIIEPLLLGTPLSYDQYISSPFTITLANNKFSSFYINSNGFLSFGKEYEIPTTKEIYSTDLVQSPLLFNTCFSQIYETVPPECEELSNVLFNQSTYIPFIFAFYSPNTHFTILASEQLSIQPGIYAQKINNGITITYNQLSSQLCQFCHTYRITLYDNQTIKIQSHTDSPKSIAGIFQRSTIPSINALNVIDAVLYINILHREDRRKHTESQLLLYGFPQHKIHRINAVYIPDHGGIGCSMSHIKALEYIKIHPEWEHILILEDDVEFQITPKEFNSLLGVFFEYYRTEYDLFQLQSYNLNTTPTHIPFIHRSYSSAHGGCYLLHRKFLSTLHANFHEGLSLLFYTLDYPVYALDVYWRRLQPYYNWYTCNPDISVQILSYSDIAKTYHGWNGTKYVQF